MEGKNGLEEILAFSKRIREGTAEILVMQKTFTTPKEAMTHLQKKHKIAITIFPAAHQCEKSQVFIPGKLCTECGLPETIKEELCGDSFTVRRLEG
ncbi:hypothetical protein ACFL0A_01785 [Patescibacteria group bacterium]